MIERETSIKVYSEVLGAKGAKGKLVRVAPEGYYEVTLEINGRNYASLLPAASTVILAAEPEPDVPAIAVER
jgi:hypothetical protein